MEPWIPVPKKIVQQLFKEQKGEKFTEALAFLSMQMDLDSGAQVSELGYSKLWGWSRDKVRNFIENSGLEIIRTAKSRKSLGNLQKKQQTDNKPTTKKHIEVNVFNNLGIENDNKKTLKKQQTNTTTNTNTQTQTKSCMQQAAAQVFESLNQEQKAYIQREIDRKKPQNPEAYALSIAKSKFINEGIDDTLQGGTSHEDYSGICHENRELYEYLEELQARAEAEAQQG